MADEEKKVTTVFRVDVSQFKRNIADATASIKLANAGFEAATASMDDWTKSSEGLEAKIKQLAAVTEANAKMMEAYKDQLEATKEAKAKNVKQADDLRRALEQMEKAGQGNTQEAKDLANQLAKLEKEIAKAEKAETDLATKMLKTEAAAKKSEKQMNDYGAQLKEVEQEGADVDEVMEDIADGVEAAGEAAEGANEGFTVLKGVLANLATEAVLKGLDLLAEAGHAIADGFASAVTAADDLKAATNQFSASTGLDAGDGSGYKEAIKNVYGDNLGESYGDVADVMATIKQTTGEIDPTKLEDLTRNALVFRDTFGFDIQEQMRAVDMLMTQFGVDSETAFNLLAQGAQNGLNKNGDLLDTINEYSVHYKQLGYSAEEMFNSLVNGAAAGTFSVDKLGDAMKEFGIRVKDTNTTTQDGFALLGYSTAEDAEKVAELTGEIAELEKNLALAKAEQAGFNGETSELTRMKTAYQIAEYAENLQNAKTELMAATHTTDGTTKSLADLQQRFAAGGETAKAAMAEALQALLALEDPVAQNAAGVALFGTMWEDLGIEGIKALTNMQGDISATDDALKKINEIKYDDLGSAWQGLGRIIKNEVAEPLGEAALPMLSDFVNALSNGFKEADGDVEAMADTVGDALGDLAQDASKHIPTLTTVGKKVVSSVVKGIAPALPDLVESGGEIIFALLDSILESLPELAPAAVEIVSELATELLEYAPEICDAGLTLLMALVDAIPAFIDRLAPQIVPIVMAIVYSLLDATPALLQGAVTLLMALVDAIPVIIDQLIVELPSIIESIIDTLIECIPILTDAAIRVLMALVDAIPVIIQTLTEKAPEIIRAVISGLIEAAPELTKASYEVLGSLLGAIPQVALDLAAEVPKLIQAIIDALLGGAADIFSAGGDLMSGVVEGMKAGWERCKNGVAEVGDKLVDGFKDFFGIHSPSTLLRDEIGKFLPAGVAEGVEDNAETALQSIRKFGRNLVGNLDVSGISDKLAVLKEGLTGSLKVSAETNPSHGGGDSTVTNNAKSVTYAPVFKYNKPLNSKEIYRQNKNMLDRIVGVDDD